MPRLAFEEPKGGPMKTAEPTDEKKARHRKGADGEHDDHTLVLLKAATVAVAIALIAAIVLLTTSGSDEPAAKSPSVPQIDTSASTGPTTTSPVGLVVPPVHTQTAEMTVAPPPPPPPVETQPTLPTGRPPGQNQFVRVGERCDTEGAYAFTESFEPVICDRRRGSGELTWRPMFR